MDPSFQTYWGKILADANNNSFNASSVLACKLAFSEYSAISSETLLLAVSIDDDGTHSLSGPFRSVKTHYFSTGIKIDILQLPK